MVNGVRRDPRTINPTSRCLAASLVGISKTGDRAPTSSGYPPGGDRPNVIVDPAQTDEFRTSPGPSFSTTSKLFAPTRPEPVEPRDRFSRRCSPHPGARSDRPGSPALLNPYIVSMDTVHPPRASHAPKASTLAGDSRALEGDTLLRRDQFRSRCKNFNTGPGSMVTAAFIPSTECRTLEAVRRQHHYEATSPSQRCSPSMDAHVHPWP